MTQHHYTISWSYYMQESDEDGPKIEYFFLFVLIHEPVVAS